MFHEIQTQFHAMGTEITVTIVDSAADTRVQNLLQQVRGLFEQEEARFSRFRAESELTSLNTCGYVENPSPQLWDVLLRAQAWWRTTLGMFDPTVLHALRLAGYDKSFERIVSEGPSHPLMDAQTPALGFQHVDLIESAGGQRTVRLNDGVGLDLGGIVKGWTVDRAAEMLRSVDGLLIDAGGDMVARGNSLESDGWCVAVEDPFQPQHDLDYLILKDGAVATSGTYRRTWTRSDGRKAHHLIDPRTGQSSETDLVSVTVQGKTAETSEIAAKVGLLLGGEAGMLWLQEKLGGKALITCADGTLRATAGWQGLVHGSSALPLSSAEALK